MSIIDKLGITPGPWSHKTEKMSYPKSEIGEYTIIHESVFETDGERFVRLHDQPVAKLIAAAPEMLEALIEELLFIEENTISSLHSEGDPYEKMKAIIEKATGKTWEEIKELI